MKAWHSIAAASLALISLAAGAQSPLKPGLWEMTTTMRYLQGPNDLLLQTTRTYTSSVCVTRAQLERHGTILPPQRPGCELSAMTRNGKATHLAMVCKGDALGTLKVDALAIDTNHATASTHFMGTVAPGTNAPPVEYTIENRFNFQRDSCGALRPEDDQIGK